MWTGTGSMANWPISGSNVRVCDTNLGPENLSLSDKFLLEDVALTTAVVLLAAELGNV